MPYEQLLDEIMVNTLSAKELIGYPQQEFRYAVCPWELEFHTTIFLASILLAFDQEKPLILLIQVDDLPESAMLYTGNIWPHFGRKRNGSHQIPELFIQNHIPQTEENYYPYLDKLFCYLGVINVNQRHLVLFVKKGEKNKNLTDLLRKLLQTEYSLLVISNCFNQLPTNPCKEASEQLISRIVKKKMSLEEQRSFPAFWLLSELLPREAEETALEQIINTWELGLDPQKSTSFWFMLR